MKAGFQIDYEIKPSPYGLGIFTSQYIPKGSLIWKYERGVNVASYKNLEETKARLNELNEADQLFFMSHVYMYNGVLNEILDDGRMWNHSETPNTGQSLDDLESTYATRDIDIGEELFDDYGYYEYPEWFVELAKSYDVPQDFITKKDSRKPGFHVEYEIKESKYGKGIFTRAFIPKDTLIWKFALNVNVKPYNDEASVRKHLETLSTQKEKYFFISHVYHCEGVLNEILDDACMWNHSDTPNTCSGFNDDWDSTYAARDILPGEELLDDYGLYEYPEWFLALYKEFNVPYDFITIKR